MFGATVPETVLLHSKLVSSGVVELVCATDFAASVHSVFRRCVNLLSGRTLITLSPVSGGPLPNGIVLDTDRDMSSLGIDPGMMVIGDGSRLSIPAAGVVVDLSAPAWSASLEATPASPPPPELAPNLDFAMHVCSSGGVPGGLGAPLAHANNLDDLLNLIAIEQQVEHGDVGANLAIELSQAIRGGDLPRAVEAAERLVGLGIGLTPSGDDFLVGFSAALTAIGHPLASSFAMACAAASRDRTTVVAEAFLLHASRGEYSRRLHDLLHALMHGDQAEVERAVNALLAWGASSGADTLVGVAMGLTAACLGNAAGDQAFQQRTA